MEPTLHTNVENSFNLISKSTLVEEVISLQILKQAGDI